MKEKDRYDYEDKECFDDYENTAINDEEYIKSLVEIFDECTR